MKLTKAQLKVLQRLTSMAQDEFMVCELDKAYKGVTLTIKYIPPINLPVASLDFGYFMVVVGPKGGLRSAGPVEKKETVGGSDAVYELGSWCDFRKHSTQFERNHGRI